jgi:two-component system response regulator FixJ
MDAAKRLVFLIEDDEAVRASMRVLLEASGYSVRDFPSAEQLLAEADARQARCIITDYHLPGMTGIDLVETLRAQGVATPAIIVSANGKALIARASRAGITAVLRKPMAAEALIQWLEQIVAEPR